jgi:ribosomal protein L37E
MICRKCGISYDVARGYCPNCRSVAHFVKQEKEGSPIFGDFCVEVCEVCERRGREVFGKRIYLSDSNARLLGFAEWFSPDEHDCSQRKNRRLI